MPLQATSGAASYDAFGGGVAAVPKYIEDYFSTYLTTGTSSTLIVNNGIDLAGKGGLVWQKGRNSVVGATSNTLFDTARGVNQLLQTNSTSAQINAASTLTSFNSNGFEIGSNNNLYVSGQTGVNWVWAKAPKFFDVVTWTGDGAATRQIPHNLGSTPGCFISKRTSETTNWIVWHRSTSNYGGILNSTAGFIYGPFASTPVNASTIEVGLDVGFGLNFAGVTYVAYLFAHNAGGFGLTGTDNVISCGSFTTDGSGNATVNLGYEPQWVMMKRSDGVGGWLMFDNMRGLTVNTTNGDAILFANLSDAESTVDWIDPTATGFNPKNIATSATYIYIAIRRGPMKVPTDGTKVLAVDISNTTGSTTNPEFVSNFPVDMYFLANRANIGGADKWYWLDRLRGDVSVNSVNTSAESAFSVAGFAFNTGVFNTPITTEYYATMFRRYPGFFDVVCYTGTGSATTFSHNLTVVPEMMIVKRRDASSSFQWAVYTAATGNSAFLMLHLTNAVITGSSNRWNSTTPTASVFSVGNDASVNASGGTYVNYLFASCPGVSKVTNFTGTGTLQTINCGFTGGARFVLIKRTDSAGDWYVWDSARGLSSSTDPYLLLNSTAAEVTSTNWVDTTSIGFQVTAASGNNVNISGASYIALAIA